MVTLGLTKFFSGKLRGFWGQIELELDRTMLKLEYLKHIIHNILL